MLHKIAKDFYEAYYQKKWNGTNAFVQNLSINEAYQVQQLVEDFRLEKGERTLGIRLAVPAHLFGNNLA